MNKIAFKTEYNPQTGNFVYKTKCPHFQEKLVGSDCFGCKYFAAVTFREQVECLKRAETVSFGSDGCSTSKRNNTSSTERKPVQMKILFK
jgi:hypothetical protein